MNLQAVRERWDALAAGLSSTLIAAGSVVRGLPLLMAARPKTPLRVLCVAAFDTLHVLRNAKRLPTTKVKMLAAVLDLGACANAAFDNKGCCPHERRRTLRLLEAAGIRSSVDEYLRRLGDLECGRPSPGGDSRRHREAVLYRQAVVRLSLGMVATTAFGDRCLDEGIRATYSDAGLNTLFRIAMQCQIIDDVLDYSRDVSAGLPSFLTASESLPQALELTRLAALGYAEDRDAARTGEGFALRIALSLVSSFTKLVIALVRWRQRVLVGRGVCGARLLPADGVG